MTITSKLEPHTMATIIEVPSQYGYCILVAVGSAFVVAWKAYQVGSARKKYKIPYPIMYSPDNQTFNCIQRAHQNTMENYPQFLMMLLIGGLEWPLLCAVGGTVWCIGRVVYAKGYYTGEPKNRSKGSFAYLGTLTLLAASTKFAFRLLGYF